MPRAAEATLPEFLARFLPHVGATDERGCWPWQSGLGNGGYGVISYKNKQYRAHRIAYEVFVGRIKPGLHVDHLCRNRRCVNPAHLEPVTPRVNNERALPFLTLKTHCLRGHAMEGSNVRVYNGNRACGACIRIRQRTRPRWRSAQVSRTVLIAFISRVARLECLGGHKADSRFYCVACRARTLVQKIEKGESR